MSCLVLASFQFQICDCASLNIKISLEQSSIDIAWDNEIL